jgi:hypothetical protein
MTDATAAAAAAAGIGALFGILTTSWKTRKDLESQYDIDLRKKRIDAYQELWKMLEPLADYSPAAPLTRPRLKTLSESLRVWYFHQGGLFLSERTRAPYFHLQKALTNLPDASERESREEIDPEIAAIIKALGSRLRTISTEDVATRVRSRLGPSSLMRRGRKLRKPLRVSVDRRWDWAADGVFACYFVLIENRSDRQVEVARVLLNNAPSLSIEPPLLVQAHEEREIAVRPKREEPSAGSVPRVEIELTNRKRVRADAPPETPIGTEALEIPTQPRVPS